MIYLPFSWPTKSYYRRIVEMLAPDRKTGRIWAREQMASVRRIRNIK